MVKPHGSCPQPGLPFRRPTAA
ncbi:putative proline-rich receptor-like protein kinase PERK3 [Iris pallida]|uniref:Proline-rich receptor-like protein kinase PERK3 n=1 Tax=Iris pallida TaxID=29817 RepID=A0AAX6DQH1_IRIPA|nr:putative proline-rich receptor-like protein kinase PERK3 [Iris pallida]